MKKFVLPILFFGVIALVWVMVQNRQYAAQQSAQVYANMDVYAAMRAWAEAQSAARNAPPAGGSNAMPAVRSSASMVTGPRDACRQRTADEQRQIDQGNQTIINRIFCPSSTPQCCTFPLPGAGEPMGRCYVRGTDCSVVNQPRPRPPRPRLECPPCSRGESCRMCRPPYDASRSTKYYTGACVLMTIPPIMTIPTCSPR